jgi:hypothetical protein
MNTPTPSHQLTISKAPPAMRKVVDAFNSWAHRTGDMHVAGAWLVTRTDGRENFEVKVRLKTGKWSSALSLAEPTDDATRAALKYLLTAHHESVSFPF